MMPANAPPAMKTGGRSGLVGWVAVMSSFLPGKALGVVGRRIRGGGVAGKLRVWGGWGGGGKGRERKGGVARVHNCAQSCTVAAVVGWSFVRITPPST